MAQTLCQRGCSCAALHYIPPNLAGDTKVVSISGQGSGSREPCSLEALQAEAECRQWGGEVELRDAKVNVGEGSVGL